MITVTGFRKRGGASVQEPTRTFNDPLEAVLRLGRAELYFGGKITRMTERSITVETTIFSSVDVSTYEGPPEEMLPVFQLACFYLEAGKKYDDSVVEEVVNELHGAVGGSTVALTALAPMMVGCRRLKIATMLACGVTDPADIKAGLGAQVQDLVAATRLSRDGHCSFREALTL